LAIAHQPSPLIFSVNVSPMVRYRIAEKQPLASGSFWPDPEVQLREHDAQKRTFLPLN
jgi:hypothetical protein